MIAGTRTGESYATLGSLAKLPASRAAERKLESASLPLIPYFVAFLKGAEDDHGRRTCVQSMSADADVTVFNEAQAEYV